MSWDSIKAPTGGNGEFYKLQPGENVVRIVSSPVERKTHFNQATKRSTPCVGNCPVCSVGDKPNTKWLFHVIDRKDGKTKLAEFGYSIVGQLKALKDDAEWTWSGEVMPYNVKIKKEGSGLDTTYTVIGSPSRIELTETERADVGKLKPLTEILEALNGKKTQEQPPAAKQPTEQEYDYSSIPFRSDL